MRELPVLTRDELLVPPEEVEEVDGLVVICWGSGEVSRQLRPPGIYY